MHDSDKTKSPAQTVRETGIAVAVAVSTVLIPSSIGLFGVFLGYLYELGYCSYFEIPRQLIKLEVSDAIMVLAKVIAIAIGLLLILAMAFRFQAPLRLHEEKGAALFSAFMGLLWIVYQGYFIDFLLVTLLAFGTAFAFASIKTQAQQLSCERIVGAYLAHAGVMIALVYFAALFNLYFAVLVAVMQIIAIIAAGGGFVTLRPDLDGEKPLDLPKIWTRRMALIALAIMAGCLPLAYAAGRGKAAETERFLCLVEKPPYALVAIYGDIMIFCEYLTQADGYHLTGCLRMRSKTSDQDKTLMWRDLGVLKTPTQPPVP
jgi:hypothetical protein